MKPEQQTEILLYGWLKPKVKEIYFNQKNLLDAPVFKVKGLNYRRVPDFIVHTNQNKFIAIEIKPTSKDNSKVNEGQMQLFDDQYVNYIKGELQFFINGEEIEINTFLLATDHSKDSSLFNLKDGHDNLRDNLKDADQHRAACILKYKTMPRFEYVRTHDLVRNLFKTHKQFLKRNIELVKKEAGLGILMADYETKEPFIYIKQKYNDRWGQHYWNLFTGMRK